MVSLTTYESLSLMIAFGVLLVTMFGVINTMIKKK